MPEQGAVDRRHPVERPALGVGRQQLVDARPGGPTTPSTSSTAYSGTGGSAAADPVGERLQRVGAALLGLEEHVERALAGLAAGGHQ